MPKRRIAASCKVARSTVADYLDWAKAAGLDEVQFDRLLFPPRASDLPRPALDMVYIR
jgi:hypothetical protein